MLFLILFYGFLLYLLYRLVFNFILPIYRTTRQVKKSFRDMQDKMNNQGSANQSQSTQQQKHQGPTPQSDYIDFEEVKE